MLILFISLIKLSSLMESRQLIIAAMRLDKKTHAIRSMHSPQQN